MHRAREAPSETLVRGPVTVRPGAMPGPTPRPAAPGELRHHVPAPATSVCSSAWTWARPPATATDSPRPARRSSTSPLPSSEPKLRAVFDKPAAKLATVLVVVDQPASIGALPLAVARDAGCKIARRPGLAMRRIAGLYPGEAKADEVLIAMPGVAVRTAAVLLVTVGDGTSFPSSVRLIRCRGWLAGGRLLAVTAVGLVADAFILPGRRGLVESGDVTCPPAVAALCGGRSASGRCLRYDTFRQDSCETERGSVSPGHRDKGDGGARRCTALSTASRSTNTPPSPRCPQPQLDDMTA